jgi:hypothetical protein
MDTPAVPAGRVILRGIELRSLLVLVLLERRRAMTVAELVDAVDRRGFALDGRPSKAVSDALRWEVGRGRVVGVRRGVYRPGHVAKVTRHRMQARVAAADRQPWARRAA